MKTASTGYPHICWTILELFSSLLTRTALVAFLVVTLWGSAGANPYVAKPGERPVTLRIATCAVSGGFVPAIVRMVENKSTTCVDAFERCIPYSKNMILRKRL